MKHKLLNPLRLLMVALCMLGIAAEGQEVVETINGIKYGFDPATQTASVLDQDIQSLPATVVIPSTVMYEGTEYTVTTIGDWAFYCSQMSEISLPETLQAIGQGAFSECQSLQSIIIPNNVSEIGEQTFAYSNIETCTLSENLKEIPYGTFHECHALQSIDIPSSVEKIGLMAFNMASSCNSITLHDGLKYIGESAFAYCENLESIIIPNTVDTVMQNAFMMCSSLKSCKLSENMTVIPGGLFFMCSSLESIEIPNSVTRFTGEFLPSDPETNPEDYDFAFEPDWYFMQGSAFMGCMNLKTVFLPKNIINIPMNTFNMTSIESIEIPPTIRHFGPDAFSGATFKTFEIPANVNYWGDMFINPTNDWKYVKSYNENPATNVTLTYSSINCPLYVPKGLSGIYSTTSNWTKFSRIVEATPVELEGEWRTFCAYEDLDFSQVEGLEAFIAKEYQDGKVLMEPIEQVPAGTGIVLKGTPGFYEIPYAEQLEPVDNLLVGLNFGERIAAETEDGNCNLFFNDATEMASLFYGPDFDIERAPAINDEDDQPAFEPADGARLPYHHAYLQLPASEAGKTVEMVFDSLTGIDNVTAAPTTDGPIYNLQGQRVTNPGPGIYIQNGRKFVVR